NVVGDPCRIAVRQGVGGALGEILVQQVVDCRVEAQVFGRAERTAQTEDLVGFQVARRVQQTLVRTAEVVVVLQEALPVTAVFTLQPDTGLGSCVPGQARCNQVFRCVGERGALVLAALLFAIGVGVVGADVPGRGELPFAA